MWCYVLLWPQTGPGTNVKDLLTPLRQPNQGRFSDAQLRTLRCRVKDWRGVMAKRLVYAASGEPIPEPAHEGELALVGVVMRG